MWGGPPGPRPTPPSASLCCARRQQKPARGPAADQESVMTLLITPLLVLVCCLLAQSATSFYKLGLDAYSKDDLPAAEAYLKQARQVDFVLVSGALLFGRH